jgi:hypothetical protein
VSPALQAGGQGFESPRVHQPLFQRNSAELRVEEHLLKKELLLSAFRILGRSFAIASLRVAFSLALFAELFRIRIKI